MDLHWRPTGRTGRSTVGDDGPVRHAMTDRRSGRQGRGRGLRAVCGATCTGQRIAPRFDLDHPRACRACVTAIRTRS